MWRREVSRQADTPSCILHFTSPDITTQPSGIGSINSEHHKGIAGNQGSDTSEPVEDQVSDYIRAIVERARVQGERLGGRAKDQESF